MNGLQSNVLIAGPSGSGKSTIARMTAESLGADVVSLDDYFIRGARHYVQTPVGNVRNFEAPELYDGARLAHDVLARGPCVIEGFCLFAYPEVLALPGRRFYLHVPFATCLARRRARRPRPSDRSFEIIGESETKRIVEPQQGLPGMIVVDGAQAIETAVAAVRRHLTRAAG